MDQNTEELENKVTESTDATLDDLEEVAGGGVKGFAFQLRCQKCHRNITHEIWVTNNHLCNDCAAKANK